MRKLVFENQLLFIEGITGTNMNPFAPLLSVEWLSLLLGDLLRAQTKQISSVNRSFFECLYLSHFALLSFQWHRLFYFIAISTSEPVRKI